MVDKHDKSLCHKYTQAIYRDKKDQLCQTFQRVVI